MDLHAEHSIFTLRSSFVSYMHHIIGVTLHQTALTPEIIKCGEETLVYKLLQAPQGEVPKFHEGQIVVGPIDGVLQGYQQL